MDVKKMFLVSTLLIIWIYTPKVIGISCYQCNSVYDPGCETLTLKETYSPYYNECIEREEHPSFCRKTHLDVVWDGVLTTRIVRSCGWVPQSTPCLRTEEADHVQIMCSCDTNACNTAATIHIFWDYTYLTFLTIVLVLFFNYAMLLIYLLL